MANVPDIKLIRTDTTLVTPEANMILSRTLTKSNIKNRETSKISDSGIIMVVYDKVTIDIPIFNKFGVLRMLESGYSLDDYSFFYFIFNRLYLTK